VITVKVLRSGPDLGLVIGQMGPALRRRLNGALTASILEWRRLVISSTWFHPTPSPGSYIIANWKSVGGGYVFKYGWTNYAGNQGRAEYRMGLRVAQFEPGVLDRIDRMVNMMGTP